MGGDGAARAQLAQICVRGRADQAAPAGSIREARNRVCAAVPERGLGLVAGRRARHLPVHLSSLPDLYAMRRSWVVDGLGEAGFATLAHELKPSELWSLLLAVMEQRSRARSPAAVRQQWESDRFVQ